MINQETKVGLFVLVGILIFVVAIILLEDINLEKGYELKIVFDSAEGLPEKGQVKIAGVEVGKVKKIDLVQDKALVIVAMNAHVKLYRDAQAKIVSVGMVGNKFLEMTSGSQNKPELQDGDVIIGVSPMSFDSIIESANDGIDNLVEKLEILKEGGELDTVLRGISSNLEGITSKLNVSLGKDGENIKKTFDNFGSISEDLNKISVKIKDMEIDDSVLSKLIADKDLGEKVENIINSLEKVSKSLERRFK